MAAPRGGPRCSPEYADDQGGRSGALGWVVSKITNTGSLDLEATFSDRERPQGTGFRAVVAFSFPGPRKKQFRLKEKSGGTGSMEFNCTAIFPEEKWFIRKVLN
jgi:hypothetical protein